MLLSVRTELERQHFLKVFSDCIPSLNGECELGENLELGYFEQEVEGENENDLYRRSYGKNFRLLHSMRCVLRLQNAGLRQSISKVRSVF